MARLAIRHKEHRTEGGDALVRFTETRGCGCRWIERLIARAPYRGGRTPENVPLVYTQANLPLSSSSESQRACTGERHGRVLKPVEVSYPITKDRLPFRVNPVIAGRSGRRPSLRHLNRFRPVVEVEEVSSHLRLTVSGLELLLIQASLYGLGVTA